MTDTMIRPARTQDVRAIRGLVDFYSPDGRLLSKATVTLFEDIQEFLVAERDGALRVRFPRRAPATREPTADGPPGVFRELDF